MSEQPFDATVVIPTYRRSKYLAEACRSAYSQVGCRVQVVVVDDGSPEPPERDPGWPENVELHHRPHLGRCAARNFGAAQARSPYLCFLDDDDGLRPDCLARHRAQFAEHPELDVSYSQVELVDEGGASLRTYLAGHQPPADYFAALAEDNLFSINAAVVRKERFDAVGGFSSDVDGRAEDYDLWLRLAAGGARFAFLAERMAWVRRHEQSSSADVVEGVRRVLEVKQAREGLLGPLRRSGRAWWLARSHYVLGRAALEAREWEEARRHLRAAVAANPSHLHARLYLALASGGGSAWLSLLQRVRRALVGRT